MPQFQMEGALEPAFLALDDFTRGYIEALFFTETEPGTTSATHDPETQSSLPGDYGFENLAPETLERIIKDCAEFQHKNSGWLRHAYLPGGGHDGEYAAIQAGRDFWFTRNGHGVGYRDRKELNEDVGRKLTRGAKECGEVWVTLGDDGKIYL